ncbi:hypothetical protein DSO57_1027611 [Entomophthora muscae]|uniref:Uncharacterized protein n=1 Tax=Entomophthora muscae TaxID=34485 RepID=A0ACC2S3N7_9FUNG|nr:hypothetical protein DSO57_1027611 [Entomophthora muscae]
MPVKSNLPEPMTSQAKMGHQKAKQLPLKPPKMTMKKPTKQQNLKCQAFPHRQHQKNAQRHLHCQYPSTGIDSQTPVDKTEAFDYYRPPNTPFGPVHFTEYPPNHNHKPWTLKVLQWYTHPNAPKEPYQIVCDDKAITIYPLIFNGKYNNNAAYLVHMEPPPTPKLTISTPPTSDVTGQSSQVLGVLYLALTGLIDSALPAAGPWAVAGKALSYLVKLGPIIWWAMPVPVSTPPSPAGAPQYSWYPDIKLHSEFSLSVLNLPSINSFSDSKVEINRIIDIKDIVTKLTELF